MIKTPEENAIRITYLCEKDGMTVNECYDACRIILLGRMAQLITMKI